MAFSTVYIRVFPFQRELRFAMVELAAVPSLKTVAPDTIRDALLLKLAAVHVVMAG